MKILLKITTLSLVSATLLSAGGYKIPETSLNAVALSSATVAHSHGADSAYYNPANMAFMPDEQNFEADMIYIGLDPVKYKSHDGATDISAQKENFLLPSFNYVSNKLGNARLGLSVTVPAGLSKRWKESPAVDRAKEFTLKVIEVNPTAAFSINDKLAVAVGLRVVSTTGIVKSTSSASRNTIGDSVDVGYNLALAYKPTKKLEIALTYRSNIDLTVEGNAKLHIGNAKVYDGGANVTVPLPATLNAAIAYTLPTNTTVEFVYERVNWSAYKTLDFNYVSPIPTILYPYFDATIVKNWKDTNAYRLGITQEMDAYTFMMGAVLDESPVPDSTLSFELPDSDSLSISAGIRYQYNDKINIGVSTLYSMRKTRDVTNPSTGVDGEFSNANVLFLSTGLSYKF